MATQGWIESAVYDPDRELIYVSVGSGQQLLRYDIAEEKLLEPFTHTGLLGGMDISPDGQTLFASEFNYGGPGILHRINLVDGTDAPLTFPARSGDQSNRFKVAAMPDGTVFHWSDDWYESPIRQIDLATGAVAEYTTAPGFDHIPRASDHKRFDILLSKQYGSDGLTLRPNVGFLPGAVSYDGSLFTRGQSVLNGASETVHQFPEFERPAAFDPVRDLLYTTNWVRREVSAFDTTTWEKVSSFGTGFYASNIVVTDDGSRMLASNENNVALFALSPRPQATFDVSADAVNVGQTVTLRVEAMGDGGAPVAWSGTLQFASDDPAASLPPDTPLSLKAGEVASFDVAFQTAGDHSITVTDAASGLFSRDQIRVDAGPPTARFVGYQHPNRANEPVLVEVYWQDDSALVATADLEAATVLEAVGPDGAVHKLDWPHYETIPVHYSSWSSNPQRYFGLRPPNGTWTPADEGDYIIRALPGAARDALGNTSPGGDIGVVHYNWDFGYDLWSFLEGVKPAAVKAGASVSTTLYLSNSGDQPAVGTSRVTISIVPDGQSPDGPGARVLRAWDQDLKLAYDAHRRFKTRVKVPGDLPDGYYRLVATATPLVGQEANENSPQDNTQQGQPFAVHAGKLVPLAAAAQPLTPGEPFTATVRLRNEGGAASGGRFLLTLFAVPVGADGVRRGDVPYPLGTFERSIRIDAAGERGVAVRVTPPARLPAGSYIITTDVGPA